MRRHSPHRRDVALARMRRVNRWLIASAVALTVVLAVVAEHAFPGRSVIRPTNSAAAATQGVSARPRHRRGSGGASQQSASQAPQATATTEQQAETPAAQEPTPAASSSAASASPATAGSQQQAPVTQQVAPTPVVTSVS